MVQTTPQNSDSQTLKPIIKDFTYQNFSEDDEKDFYIRTIDEEMLITPFPGLDEGFTEDMRNIGDEEDLPDSDRTMACQTKKISRSDCFDF